jgi:hypothetical protein
MKNQSYNRPITTQLLAGYAVALVLLATQSLFFSLVGPFYPAVAMPGFDGSGGYRDGVVYRSVCDIVVVNNDNTDHGTISPATLFKPLPANAAPKLLGFVFGSKKTAYGSKVPSNLKNVVRYFLPGYFASRESRNDPASQEQIRQWLSQRIDEILPDNNVKAVEFRWQTVGLPAAWTNLSSTAIANETLRIELEPR